MVGLDLNALVQFGEGFVVFLRVNKDTSPIVGRDGTVWGALSRTDLESAPPEAALGSLLAASPKRSTAALKAAAALAKSLVA